MTPGKVARIVGCLLAVFLYAISAVAAKETALASATPDRGVFLKLARVGWVFDIHSSRMRRDADLPPVLFDSAEVALGEVCVFGDRPHALDRQIIRTFTDLLREVYDRRISVSFVGREMSNCPPRQRVYIRLYTGLPPLTRFNDDLRRMDREFDIRFPPNWTEPVTSPAQANGFFGRNGAAAHLLISQPPDDALTLLQRDFYGSILIEELFQVVSFGADILKFDRDTPFYSKLQEVPVNLRYMPWASEGFMSGLLKSNPKGLCGFDIFMLHALASARLETTNTTRLLEFIDAKFDDLRARTARTLANPHYAPVLDESCREMPG